MASDGGRYSSLGQLPLARGPPSELWVWGVPGRAAGGTLTQTASLLGMPGSSSARWLISYQSRSSGPFLARRLWLAQNPEGVEQCVWDLVVLAAITAMEQGRRFMAATLAGDPQEAPGPLLERAITRVVVEFWGRLRGFAALGLPRKG